MNVREQLALFVDRADQLARCRMLQRHHRVGFTLNFDRLQGLMSVVTDEPDEDELRSMLMTLRLFILQGEPVFLPRIHNLCHQHLTDTGLRDRLVEARAKWKQVSRRLPEFAFHVNDQELTPEHVADLLINGHYFHSDPDKMKELQEVSGGQPQAMFTRLQFLRYVLSTAKQVLYVANVIRVALRDNRLSA